jgi:hypothetical protein
MKAFTFHRGRAGEDKNRRLWLGFWRQEGKRTEIAKPDGVPEIFYKIFHIYHQFIVSNLVAHAIALNIDKK